MNSIIKAIDLHKSYLLGKKTVSVLKGVDLDVKTGEMLSITGVSGVGKSTLLHLLGTLDAPTSGQIIFNGEEPFKLSALKLSFFRNESIGFIFQAHHLLPEFTACENVMIPLLINRYEKKKAREVAEKILSEVELTERLNHKPGELSGGEQQRVAVARALVNKPNVIIADEPTGNLDAETGRSIHTLLRKINKEHRITFIIATHNIQLAMQTDRSLKLVNGKLLDGKERGE